jgi:selenocysteine lyase/cysteine desulfurase
MLPPPHTRFGHALLPYFPQRDYLSVNNGSWGPAPLYITDAQLGYMQRAIAKPDIFYRLELDDLVNKARHVAASVLGVNNVDQVVLVPNTTYAIASVINNFKWNKYDKILVTNITYEHEGKQVEYLVKELYAHLQLEVVRVDLPLPCSNAEIIKSVEQVLRTSGPVRMAILDHVSSVPAIQLPLKELVEACHAHGTRVLVDGAQAYGQVKDLNLDILGADYYATNPHKWGYAAVSAAVLHVKDVHERVYPAVSSHYYKHGDKHYNMAQSFSWTGTINWSSLLTITDAFRFRQALGGEHAIIDYCHNLALSGSEILMRAWNTERIETGEEQTACMSSVRLPLSKSEIVVLQDRGMTARQLTMELYRRGNTWAPVYAWNNLWWMRISAQVYNEPKDFETLAHLGLKVLAGMFAHGAKL